MNYIKIYILESWDKFVFPSIFYTTSQIDMSQPLRRQFDNEMVINSQDLFRKINSQVYSVRNTVIANKTLAALYAFDNISLWQFVESSWYGYDEHCKSIYIIEALFAISEETNCRNLHIYGNFTKKYQRIFEQLRGGFTLVIHELSPKPAVWGKVVKRFMKIKDRFAKRLSPSPKPDPIESGDATAISAYIRNLRKVSGRHIAPGGVLLASFPRGLSNGQDIYFSSFADFFTEKGIHAARLEVPYYFQIQGNKKAYLEKMLAKPSSGYPNCFFHEYYEKSDMDYANSFRKYFEELFARLSTNPNFCASLSWRGMDLVKMEYDFWKQCMVELPIHCIATLRTARRLLDTLKPKAIFLVYETGDYARALTIEARRRSIPCIGLQHACIYDTHSYYHLQNQDTLQTLDAPFYGTVCADKTLVWGEDHKHILTKIFSYPEASVEVVGNWLFLDCGDQKIFIDSNKKKKIAFLASSDMEGMEESVVTRFNNDDYAILLKIHPQYDNYKHYHDFFTSKGYEVCDVSGYTTQKIISCADIVATSNSSTVALESLFGGKVTIVKKTPSFIPTWDSFTLDISQLYDLGEVDIPHKERLPSYLNSAGYRRLTRAEFTQALDRAVGEYFQ